MEVRKRKVGLPFIMKVGAFVLFLCIIAFMAKEEHLLKETNQTITKQQHLLKETKSATSKKFVVKKNKSKHPKCQLIYVVAIEGSSHHGFLPVLERFVTEQVNEHGNSFNLYSNKRTVLQVMNFTDLKVRKFWGYTGEESPEQRKEVMKTICPSDGSNNVIICDKSFPAFMEYRKKLVNMTAAEIAAHLKLNPNPISLIDLPQLFEPFADVHYILLHRQWLNTVASHPYFDGGFAEHGRVISGYQQYLGDLFSNNDVVKAVPTSVVCSDLMDQKEYQEQVLEELATQFQWKKNACSNCFDTWKASKKNPEIDIQSFKYLIELQQNASSVWPPRDIEFVCPL